ncbi:MAG TPA: single-stranded DNA-binding protein [Solirubrobacteraceae bacterium]|nr:single-stranded DNA-binding protein [Solirubrobacteraceae bacterium]
MARRKSTTAAAPEASAPAPVSATDQPADSRTTLRGRLCADPVLRHTSSGRAVTNLRLAVNHPDGAATFHDVVVWGRTAEVVCQYLKKGRLVEVEGRPQERSWTAQDGTERRTEEISAYRVQFIAGRRQEQPQAEKELA